MAGRTIGGTHGGMVEGDLLPITGNMTTGALTRKMVWRRILRMAGLAINCVCQFMIEADIRPRSGTMAGGAISLEVRLGYISEVALDASVRGTQILPGAVASGAQLEGMLANQGIKGMLRCLAPGRKGDQPGSPDGSRGSSGGLAGLIEAEAGDLAQLPI